MPDETIAPRLSLLLASAAVVVAGVALALSLGGRREAKAGTPVADPPAAEPAMAAEAARPAPLDARPGDGGAVRAELEAIRARLEKVEGRVGLGPRAAGDDGTDVDSSKPAPAAKT